MIYPLTTNHAMYLDSLTLSIRLDEDKTKSILSRDKFNTKQEKVKILFMAISKLSSILKLLSQVASMMKPCQGSRWHCIFLTKSRLDETEL